MTTRSNHRQAGSTNVGNPPSPRKSRSRREALRKTVSVPSARARHIPGLNPDATPC